jgi:hypothetical protein
MARRDSRTSVRRHQVEKRATLEDEEVGRAEGHDARGGRQPIEDGVVRNDAGGAHDVDYAHDIARSARGAADDLYGPAHEDEEPLGDLPLPHDVPLREEPAWRRESRDLTNDLGRDVTQPLNQRELGGCVELMGPRHHG